MATQALPPCLSSRPAPRASARATHSAEEAERGLYITTKEEEYEVLKKKKTRKEIKINEMGFIHLEHMTQAV